MSTRRSAWIGILTLIAAIRLASTYRIFSQTVDEPIHVAAGFQLLTAGRYDLDFEHPPLARVLFAIGPALAGARVDPKADRVEQGREIFCRDTNYRHNLAQSRIGNLPFFIAALIAVAAWARRLSGWGGALIAVALLGSLPPVLGHAGLATTDMSVTATTPIALLLFWIWLRKPTWPAALALGGAIGIGLMSKFSFPVFFGTGAAVAIAAHFIDRDHPVERRFRRTALQVLVMTVVSMLMVWGSYRFSTGTMNDLRRNFFAQTDPWNVAARYAAVPGYEWVRPDIVKSYWAYGRYVKRQGMHGVDFVDWAKAAGYRSPLAGRSGDTMRGAPPLLPRDWRDVLLEPARRVQARTFARVPIPAPEFFVGLMYVQRHSQIGHGAFFLGDYRYHGWWYYFPVVFFFKTPVAFTLLAIAGVALLLRRGVRRRDGEALLVAIAPLAMFVPAMASGLNIGLRHILPVYPLLCVAAACAITALWRGASMAADGEARSGAPFARIAVAALLVWYFAGTARAHPDYLGYFNELAGPHPDWIVVDSNLDWGQDLLRLTEVKRRRPIDRLHLAYFGNTIWRNSTVEPLEPGLCTTGWVAISETLVKQGDPDHRGGGYRWLDRFSYEEVGRSIRLYHIPENACR